jgi:hypothetical protein
MGGISWLAEGLLGFQKEPLHEFKAFFTKYKRITYVETVSSVQLKALFT